MVEKAALENVQDLVKLRMLLMKELGELNGNEELFQKATEEYFIANINNPNSYTAILKADGEIYQQEASSFLYVRLHRVTSKEKKHML